MPQLWPDFRPAPTLANPTPQLAREMLETIKIRCDAGFASGPYAGNQLWLDIKAKAQQDMGLVAHGNLLARAILSGPDRGQGQPTAGEPPVTLGEIKLGVTWDDVLQCRNEVTPPTVNLLAAIGHIDHLGGTGSNVFVRIDPLVNGHWPNVRTGLRSKDPKSMTAKTLLDGIVIMCLEPLIAPKLKAKRRALLEALIAAATLDGVNADHGNLRVLVRVDGKGVKAGSLAKAMKSVKDTYDAIEAALEAGGLTDAVLKSALDAIGHEA